MEYGMKHCYKCSYENIIVRPLEAGDIESLRQWRNDPANTKFLKQIPYITPEMQKSWYERYLDDASELQFAICFKDSGELIGSCALYDPGVSDDTENYRQEPKGLTFKDVADVRVDSDDAGSWSAEFGKFMIGAGDAHGKHAGVSAVKAIAEIAFYNMGLEKLVLHVFCDHLAAVKVYQQAGFEIADEHIADNGAPEFLMTMCR